MDKKLYGLMDWAAIEAVVYGETDSPQALLGPHTVGKQTLVQAYFPGSKKAALYINGAEGSRGKTVKEEIKMEMVDEAGYYAALLSGKDRKDYTYHVEYETDKVTKSGRKSTKSVNYQECYCHTNLVTEKMAEKFYAGTDLECYELLGSRRMTVGGVRGCRFVVWAPQAVRVSVVGDFNQWNPLQNMMCRNADTGLFEIFIPGVEDGDKYKYQILIQGREPFYKADPYSMQVEDKAGRASIVTTDGGFKWSDDAYLKARSRQKALAMPYNAYEVCLGSLPEAKSPREAADNLVSYVRSMHYTHVELMPIMENAKKEAAGYSVAQFYAVSSAFGAPEDYKYLVNELHKAGIGVILQWPVQSFDDEAQGLGYFDGSALYEYEDARRGIDARSGRHMFQYARPEVYSFLASNACFYARQYHADGLKFCDLASILYLDYYRSWGEWVPNIYGGNENLESIDFIKNINAMLHKQFPGFLTIAEDESCWPNLTLGNRSTKSKQAEFESLGFDLAVDFGYNEDLLAYMKADPIERKNLHDKLTMSSIYQYNENFILPVMHQNTGFDQGNLLSQMPGEWKDKIASLKVFYGYNMLHVGKKQMFMGQDSGQGGSFSADYRLDALNGKGEGLAELSNYCRDLNEFYLKHKWLFEKEAAEKSFEWINQISANENVISFVRRGGKKDERLTVILNFANTEYTRYRFGCDEQGKYKEVFTSDLKKYYGEGRTNARLVPTRTESYDGRDYSFVLTLAPLSMTILEFTPYTDAELAEIRKKQEIREAKQKEVEDERRKRILEKERMQRLFAAEKAKIRKEMKKEMERRYKEAEERIFGKTEFDNTCHNVKLNNK